jgi:hypothetical protein
MYQDITITNAADIDTATMTAWCQWNDALPAANAEVSKSYLEFNVTLKDPDNNFHYIKNTKRYFGSLTALALMTAEDIKSELQAGGNGTWSIIFAINIYRANITGVWLVGWYDDLSLDISYNAYGTTTETITLSDSASGVAVLSSGHTETITLSDSGSGAFGSGPGTPEDPEEPDPLVVYSADPVFRYYFGSYEGKVYAEESVYMADDDASIDAYWESKETDFAEESIDALDKFKTIYKVRLWYVDISSSSATVVISIKADGGTTWTTITESIGGTGDDTTKSKDFYIIKTGHSFRFRIEHNSIDNEFQWSALEVFYTLGGDYFQE